MSSSGAKLFQSAAALFALGLAAPGSGATALPENQLKAAFLYNFAVFTEWPADTGPTVTLCVINGTEFRNEFDEFLGQPVGSRRFAMRHVQDADAVQGCQLAYLPRRTPAAMARSLRMLNGRRNLLTVGDSPEAEQAGVAINMAVKDAHMTFEVNFKSIQYSGLTLSSKLLRLSQHAH